MPLDFHHQPFGAVRMSFFLLSLRMSSGFDTLKSHFRFLLDWACGCVSETKLMIKSDHVVSDLPVRPWISAIDEGERAIG